MAKQIRVYGQSQKWTALGIVAAYLEMHPNATLSDLMKLTRWTALSAKKKTANSMKNSPNRLLTWRCS